MAPIQASTIFTAVPTVTLDIVKQALAEAHKRPDVPTVKPLDLDGARTARLRGLLEPLQDGATSTGLAEWQNDMAQYHWANAWPIYDLDGLSKELSADRMGYWLFDAKLAQAFTDRTAEDFAVLRDHVGFNFCLQEVTWKGVELIIPRIHAVDPFSGVVLPNMIPVVLASTQPNYDSFVRSVTRGAIESLLPEGLVLQD